MGEYHVIVSWNKVSRFLEGHPGDPSLKNSFDRWHALVKKTRFVSFHDVQKTFGKASLVDGLVVFNIGGNKCRMITRINFRSGHIYIRDVLTHKEYDNGKWKT